jgi:hypothetical protein
MGGPDKAGLSTLDLMNSSPSVNRVVRVMLKKPQQSYRELLDTVTQLPEEKRLSAQVLEDALNTLIKMGWLGKTGDGDDAIYSVVLKPKASSSEQLHSSDLPPLDVAGDRKMDPGLNAPEVRIKPEEAQKGPSFGDRLKSLFGPKK